MADKIDKAMKLLEKFDASEFGSIWPDPPELKQFSLGPWHELRRHLTLFLGQVAPADTKQMDVREIPSELVETQCDEWIANFLVAKNKKGKFPPAPLRKWLGVRAKVALIFLEQEIEKKKADEAQNPDLKNNFNAEVSLRLVTWWHDFGKRAWLDNDSKHSSLAE
jgi:hypothetical protein